MLPNNVLLRFMQPPPHAATRAGTAPRFSLMMSGRYPLPGPAVPHTAGNVGPFPRERRSERESLSPHNNGFDRIFPSLHHPSYRNFLRGTERVG
jgi:hypothetical protein